MTATKQKYLLFSPGYAILIYILKKGVNHMKKRNLAILALALATTASAETTALFVNDAAITPVTEISNQNETAFIPLRSVCEAIKAGIAWEPETKSVMIRTANDTVIMQISNHLAFCNESAFTLEQAPFLQDDYTMVPVQFLTEVLKLEVATDADGIRINEKVSTETTEKPATEPEQTQEPEAEGEKKEEVTEEKEPEEMIAITIEMEDGGIMKAELYPEIAPITVENFVKLAKEGFYDGLIFHRVIEDFMIQGGGYDKDMNEKPADSIKGEFASNGVENKLLHTRGVLSMARTMVADSASSQFFIMHADAPYLDGEYAAFGKLTEGFEVLDKIATTKTGTVGFMSDVPEEAQIIKTIIVEE